MDQDSFSRTLLILVGARKSKKMQVFCILPVRAYLKSPQYNVRALATTRKCNEWEMVTAFSQTAMLHFPSTVRVSQANRSGNGIKRGSCSQRGDRAAEGVPEIAEIAECHKLGWCE